VRLRAACLAAAALAAVGLMAAGCGSTNRVREPDLVVSGATPTPRESIRQQEEQDESTTIAVVTHGQASSPFWAVVRNGIDAAERQMRVEVVYSAPDIFDVETMAGLIDAAVARKPDGLVVSIPAEELAPAIGRAIRAGVPVVSINSGSDVSRRLGTLAHIGQPEEKAGYEAGRRLVAAGAADALCVNQEVGNEGLDRRCAGFARALREVGGVSRVLAVDDTKVAEARRLVADAASQDGIDAVLTLNSTIGELAAESAPRRVALGTFDYSPAVLTAVMSGRIEFAVDQQPYLQGYLPVVLLAERTRYGLFPAEGEVIPTGPSFITRENAAQADRLSQLGIR
jgi:simple sugar transport system substrate-binding protein